MRSDTMTTDEDLVREYLLGGLSEDEVDALERRLLVNDELFDLAEAVEGDLLAACARGELGAEERRRVLRRLAASPGGQARLALAQGLAALAAQEKGGEGGAVLPFRPRPLPARWSTRVAAIAASLAVAVGLGWLALQTSDPGEVVVAERGAPAPADDRRPAAQTPEARPPAPSATEPAAPAMPEAPAVPEEDARIAETTPAPAPRQPERAPEAAVPSVVRAVLAFAHRTRSGGASEVTRIEVPPGTRTVELHLPLVEDEEAAFFRAVLLDAAEEEIAKWEQIEAADDPAGRVIIVAIPTTEIPPGRYAIEVRGMTSEGEYELLGKPVFEVRQP